MKQARIDHLAFAAPCCRNSVNSNVQAKIRGNLVVENICIMAKDLDINSRMCYSTYENTELENRIVRKGKFIGTPDQSLTSSIISIQHGIKILGTKEEVVVIRAMMAGEEFSSHALDNESIKNVLYEKAFDRIQKNNYQYTI